MSSEFDPAQHHTVPSGEVTREVPRIELTITRLAGQAVTQSVVVDSTLVRIGSHPSNDVVLDDPQVSKFHCRLARADRHWRLLDSGSLNGTRIAGIPVRDADLVFPECRIELGDSSLHVQELGSGITEELSDALNCGALYGQSTAMRRLFHQIRLAARSDVSVLIEGETGTGKELVASELVTRSRRNDKPLVVVDCGSIPANLVESELFGHARGAFTGAHQARVGAFEAADGGTLFLDEIGELPLEMQPKLLRVLAEREFHRMGENKVRKIDVRVIAATNRQLDREVNAGLFREDLYFRLAVVTLRVPPLRERTDDLPLLVHHFLDALGAIDHRHLFTPELLAAMATQPWPGNVRELRNYIERRVLVDDAAFEQPALPSVGPDTAWEVGIDVPFKAAKEALVGAFEKRYLQALLEWAQGNVSKAARKAGLDRMYVHRLMQRHGIARPAEADDGKSVPPNRG